jgi:hypothetical protein
MANENIIGKIIILLELPDGGIMLHPSLPSDPSHQKGDLEIISSMIEDGIADTNWSYSGIIKYDSQEAFTLTYGGA